MAASTGATGPFPGKSLRGDVGPVVASLPTTTARQPEVDTMRERPPDLGELAESATSLGSFGLRWQLIESAAKPSTAAH